MVWNKIRERIGSVSVGRFSVGIFKGWSEKSFLIR